MSFKIALIQMQVVKDTETNIRHAHELALEASRNNADLIVLPEIFTCIYNAKNFPLHAFERDSLPYQKIREIAVSTGSYLVAGSVPERDGDAVYNTSFTFSPDGMELCRHRKVHLFDIDVEGGQRFMESETLTAGRDLTIFETPFAKIGVLICYDIRFPEFSRLLVDEGAELIVMPAAFNMTTGPAHWELSLRARALDNQVFYCACAPARNPDSSYISYANSMVTTPWGEVLTRAGSEEEILYAQIDLNHEKKVRRELPLLKHRRLDLYTLSKTGE